MGIDKQRKVAKMQIKPFLGGAAYDRRKLKERYGGKRESWSKHKAQRKNSQKLTKTPKKAAKIKK